MKCSIIYLSLAGNTRLAAQKIQEGVQASGNLCEIFEMRDVEGRIDFLKDLIANNDIIGLMAPVYGFREPTIFRSFLKSLPPSSSKNFPVFIAGTATGHFSNFFHGIAKSIQKKKFWPIATLKVYAPRTYTIWNKPDLDFEFKSSEQEKAREFGASLAENFEKIVVRGEQAPVEIKSSLGDKLNAMMSAHDSMLRMFVGKLEINNEKCTRCGLCVTNCAWGALSQEEGQDGKLGFPILNKKACGGCCACVNLCPTEAIGNKKLADKIRYHEPSYKGYKRLSPIR